jgi:hypothetical protein
MKKRIIQKRLKISKLHKRYFIMVLIILILANVGLALNEMMKKETTEETQVASSFSNTPGITYKVYLKENVLFNDLIQPEDSGYFSNLTDHIEVSFDNKYQGVNGTEYKGNYALMGEITGWEPGTETPSPAWMKQFVISSKKNFQTTDGELNFSQSANIDFSHFNAFAVQVAEQTGYNTSCTMKVTMVVNYTITTAEEEVTGTLQPSLTIPLGAKYFKITKAGNEEIKNDITKTVEVQVPIDYTKIGLFLAVSLLCLILIIFFISSVEPTLIDVQSKQVRKLLKSHGNRLVAVYDNIVNETLSICSVHSMSDMVKIADEIERPILYVFQNDLADIKEFFIIEHEKAYLYKVPVCQHKEKNKKDSAKAEASTESGDSNTPVTV